ncbi:hypothetical protein JCM12296A_44970 [Desulfosarcina cetonica]
MTPELRRALAALAQLDAEIGAVKALVRGIRYFESMLPTLLDASMDDLAAYPLSGFTPPFRDESVRRDEARSRRADNAPIPVPSPTRPFEKGFAGSVSESLTRGGGGAAFSIDRKKPAVTPKGVSEGRAGVGPFSPIRPASPAAGNGVDPITRASNPPAAAAGALSAGKRHPADPITSKGMETLLQLVEAIETKRGLGRESHRTGNAPIGMASHSLTGSPVRFQRPLRPSERFDFSSARSSRPEPLASAESSRRERLAPPPVAPSAQHQMDGDNRGPLPVCSPLIPSEMGAPLEEGGGRAGDQRNDMKPTGHSSNVPMNTPGPNAPGSPSAFQRFTGNGEFADAGEQLADLINTALQAQARRRGLS